MAYTTKPKYIYRVNKKIEKRVHLKVRNEEKKFVYAYDESGNPIMQKRVSSEKGYRVQIYINGKHIRKAYYDGVYGSAKEAKAAAQAFVDEFKAEHPEHNTYKPPQAILFRKRWYDPKTKKIYDYMVLEYRNIKSRTDKKIRTKLFNIEKHGYEGAIEKAKDVFPEIAKKYKLEPEFKIVERHFKLNKEGAS